MTLRTIAEADLATILEDSGNGWPITLISPDGIERPFTGFSGDIAQVIDPDTGQAVSGRHAHIALRISSIYAAGFILPVGISDTTRKPWRAKFNDINGRPWTFKIVATYPDRTIGIVTCALEIFK